MAGNKEKLKLSRDAKILLVVAGLFTVAIGLSSTFVNIFIWRINQDFVVIGIYNLSIHIALPLTFILAGYFSKKIDGTITLRLGVVFHAFFFIIILILKEKAVNFVIPLGIFLGIAGGFYWLAFQVLTFDLTNDMNRDTFNSYNGIVGSLSGMMAPLTAGLIISKMNNLSGYYLVFTISFIIFILIILISTILHTYKFDEDFKLLKMIKDANTGWRSMMTGNFFFGIRNGVLMFLINLLIYIVVKNELSIGKTSMIGALISSVSFEFVERYMIPARRKLFLSLGAIMMLIAIIPIIIEITFINILIFIIINASFAPFFNVPFNSAVYNLIDKSKHQKERIELIIFKELELNLGRIMGISSFIIITGLTQDTSILKGFLLVIASTQLIIPFLINYINRETEVI